MWCKSGRRADAELELHTWQRHSDCPAAAKILLAALLAQRDRLDDAIDLLHKAAQAHGEDEPAVDQLLISVLTVAELYEAAKRVAWRLYDQHGHEPSVAAWLGWMQPPGCAHLPAVPDAVVEQLAGELLDRPGLITSLVVAAESWQGDDDVQILRRAVELASRQITDPDMRLTVCRAMTELCRYVSDDDEVRRWAHRGLKIDPYCAPLAIAISRLDDDQTTGASASAVLQQAVNEHPDYPDLRAALIRREAAAGNMAGARFHLARWQHQGPAHPLRDQLEQELAA